MTLAEDGKLFEYVPGCKLADFFENHRQVFDDILGLRRVCREFSRVSKQRKKIIFSFPQNKCG